MINADRLTDRADAQWRFCCGKGLDESHERGAAEAPAIVRSATPGLRLRAPWSVVILNVEGAAAAKRAARAPASAANACEGVRDGVDVVGSAHSEHLTCTLTCIEVNVTLHVHAT